MITTSTTDLGEMLELMLLQSASRFGLHDPSERERSSRELRRLFVALQRAAQPAFALDIGAYGAEIALELARTGIPVHAFEANASHHARCATAIAGSGLPIQYRQAAVGGEDGLVPFHARPDRPGAAAERRAGANSLLMPLREGVQIETVTISCTRLDSYFARQGLTGQAFSASVDIAGALGPMLDGAGQVFDLCASALVVVEDRAIWSGQMLAPEAVVAFLDRGLVPVARDFRRRYQYAMLFLRRDLLRLAEVRLVLADHLARRP